MATRAEDRFTAHAAPVLNREHGATVTLKRGSIATAEFTARRGLRDFQVLGSNVGISVVVETRRYRLPKPKVLLSGQTVSPQVNDLILEGTETWEIRQPSDGVAAVDEHGAEWVCHTERQIT